MLNYFRGWLVIEMIQITGTAYQCIANPKAIDEALLSTATTRTPSSPHFHHLLSLFCAQQLISRAALLLVVSSSPSYNLSASRSLHLLNITQQLLYMGYLLSELFYFACFALTIATVTQFAMSAISIAATTLHLFISCSKGLGEKDERTRRPRKIIAKHFMESQVLEKMEHSMAAKKHQ